MSSVCRDNQLIKDENLTFSMAAMSVLGDRSEQQDSFGYALKNRDGIVVICDGMGGYEGGKQASEIAVNSMLSAYDNLSVDSMIVGAKDADKKIAALSDMNGNRMKSGSTIVAVAVKNNCIMWCSVGDSRAYLLRSGEFVQLTKDQNYHTVLDEKLNAGMINREIYDAEMIRGEALVSFVGIGNLQLVDYSVRPVPLLKDDKIILMSDGLYKLLTDDELSRLAENFNNVSDAVNAFEIKAQKNAKKYNAVRDNMTVAVIKVK